MSEEPGGFPPPHRKRRWPAVVLAAILLPLALLTALVAYRTEVAELAAIRWLGGLGIDTMNLTVETLDFGRIRLRDARFGDAGPSFERAEITYAPGDLLDGRLGRIEIEGLEAAVRLGGDGPEIEGLPPFASGADGPGGLPDLPFESVTLEDFSVRVRSPMGAVAVSGDAAVRPRASGGVGFDARATASGDAGTLSAEAAGEVVESDDGALTVRADFSGTAEVQRAATPFAGEVQATRTPAGDVDGRLALRDADISDDRGRIAGLGGDVRFGLDAGELERVAADLRIGSARVGETEIGASTLHLTYDEGRLTASTDLQWRGGSLKASISPAEPRAALPYEVAIDGTVAADWLASVADTAVETSGTIGLVADGRIVDPTAWFGAGEITPAKILTLGNLEGRVSLDLGRTTLAEVGSAEKIAGALDIRLNEDALRLGTEGEIVAGQVTLAPSLTDDIPPALKEVAGAPFDLSVGRTEPAEIVLRPDGPATVAEAQLHAAVATPSGSLSITATAAAGIGADLGLTDPRVETVALSADGLAVAGITANGTASFSDLTVAPQSVRGDVAVDLRVSGRPAAGIEVRNLVMKAAGAFDLRDGQLAFLPAGNADIRLARLNAGRFAIATPLAARLSPGKKGEPLIIDFSSGISGSLRTGPLDFRLTVARPAPLELRVAADRLDVDATAGRYAVALSGGRLTLAEYRLALNGVSAKASLNGNGGFAARLGAAEVRHLETPPWVVPLKLEARVEGTRSRAAFNGELFDQGRRLVAKASGTHSLSTGRGQGRVDLEPIFFIPTVLQLRQLFPAAYQLRIDLDARTEASAEAAWGPDGFRSSGSVDAEITELATGEVEMREVATLLRFDSLAPPSTLPGQLVSIGELNVGLPLTDGIIRLELHPDLRITGTVEQLQLFGGSIRTEPFVLDPDEPVTEILLRVQQIDLAKFLEFAQFGEMVATGTLQGTIPVVIENGEVAIRNAVLETAEEGGILQYRPQGVSEALEQANEATEVLMKAVRDFRYTRIRVFINETSAEEMTFRMTLEGKSPDVYDGLPLQLNVNISGPLKDILSRGLKTYQLPAELGRQLQEQAR